MVARHHITVRRWPEMVDFAAVSRDGTQRGSSPAEAGDSDGDRRSARAAGTAGGASSAGAGSHPRVTPPALVIARVLHSRAARGETGVLLIPGAATGAGDAPRRVALRDGDVVAVDAGPDAPVTPSAQLRFVLRLRGRPEFSAFATMSARFAVPPFRPDLSIRQHIDAQQLSHEPLRAQLGSERIAVILPPHASSLHGEEQALVTYLREPRSVPELLDEGAKSGRWSPLRALRMLVVLDSLGILMLGGASGAMAEALSLLGLSAAATLEEIKGAYRRLAREHHPDRHPHLDAQTQRSLSAQFAQLTDAYRLLLRARS